MEYAEKIHTFRPLEQLRNLCDYFLLIPTSSAKNNEKLDRKDAIRFLIFLPDIKSNAFLRNPLKSALKISFSLYFVHNEP